MTLRISNVRLSVDEPEAHLPERLAAVLGVSPGDLLRWRICARAWTPATRTPCNSSTPPRWPSPTRNGASPPAPVAPHRAARVDRYEEEPFVVPPPGTRPLPHRPVVIGSGPGGLAAAWFLAEQGYRPLVLERGRAVRDRIRDVRAFDAGGPLDPESNYLFGEGGAGTFSDGKLTCRSRGPDVRRVLRIVRRVQGQAVDPVRCPAAPGQQPPAGRGQGPAPPGRGAGRRGAFSVPRRGPRPGRRPAARPGDLVRLRPRVGRRSWRSATAPATPTRCCCAAACRWCRKPFQMGVRIEQPQETVNRVQVRPDAAGAAPRGRRLHAGGPRTDTTCSRSACAPAATSCRACRSRATSAPTA